MDKVVAVTGGATGIGEAICKLFARHGAKVVVNGLPGDPVDEVVAEIRHHGGEAHAYIRDIGELEGAEGLVAETIAVYGRLDTMIPNAGLWPSEKPLHEFPPGEFEDLLHSNVKGVYWCVRSALPELIKTRGSVIAASSDLGVISSLGVVSYSATKGFVDAFIRGVAAEYAMYGVRANAVSPGPIDTEMTRPTKGNISIRNALITVEAVPMGRRGTPEEVANAYLFLASDMASYVTGVVFPVDGGTLATTGVSGLLAKRETKTPPPDTLELKHQYAGRGDLAG